VSFHIEGLGEVLETKDIFAPVTLNASERQTGRTTRMVREAVEAHAKSANGGPEVVVIVCNTRMMKYVKRLAAQMGADRLFDVMVEDEAWERLAGWRGRVFVDHACSEHTKAVRAEYAPGAG